MSLKDRIEQLQKDARHYDDAVEEARRELWDSNYVRRHDERRKGEDDKHWKLRRKRNRSRYKRREDVVEHLAKKKAHIEKEIEQLRHKREEVQDDDGGKSSGYDRNSGRIVTFDGKSCVEDLAYWLAVARRNGWNGSLVSGYRTPAYSTSLCYGICGAPSCPGRCAGASSNHARTAYPGPAGDVTDYYTCERVLQQVGSPYFNDLPIDPVHMSRSGH